jgi:hypothetical protein
MYMRTSMAYCGCYMVSNKLRMYQQRILPGAQPIVFCRCKS